MHIVSRLHGSMLWRRWQLGLLPLLVLSLFGCKDPYSSKPGSFPPPVETRNKKFGSLQQVYQEPKLTRKAPPRPTGPVSRTPIDIRNSYIYGDPDAKITLVEFSDFQ
ncbi:MAG: hypothetical protein EP343_06690 [Deltaproteobacteria bacterium]|nr:MAG: hypothetical protein EP343_06690 [Deltaproteobacteria bacterium]